MDNKLFSEIMLQQVIKNFLNLIENIVNSYQFEEMHLRHPFQPYTVCSKT